MFGDLNIIRFISLVLIFVVSVMFVIVSSNVISILLGRNGLDLVSYLLVIYYQNVRSYGAGMLTVLSNHCCVLSVYNTLYKVISHNLCSGPGSSVGIATELRAGRSGMESRWGRDFPPVQTGPGAHPASCKMGTGSFPGVKCGRGVLLNTHTLLVPRSWKSSAITLPTLWATPGL